LTPVIVALVTVPLFLDAIGAARYGVLSVAWLLLGYFGVFNLGLGRATGNRIAKLREAPAEERQRVFWTALALNGALGVLGGVCLLLVGYPLVRDVLTLSPQLRTELLHGLPWLAVGVPFVTVSLVCIGALEGLERFGAVNAIEVATTAVYQLAPLAVAYALTPSLTSLVAAAACAPILGALLAFAACIRLVPLSERPRVDRSLAGPLFRYGGWIMISDVVSPLLLALDRFVIGAVSGPRAVTHYTVPLALVSRLGVVPRSLARSLFPRLSFLGGADAKGVALDATRGLAVVVTPLIVGAMVLVDPFLRVWVGDSVARHAAPVAEILLVGVWFNSLAFVPSTLLQARGRPDLPAKFHLLELAPYVLGLWLALSLWGIDGAAAVWTLRVAADAVLLGFASRVYKGRPVPLLVPLTLVLAGFVVATATFDSDVTRIAVGGVLTLSATWWSWRTAPRRLRLLVPVRVSQ
jgi:O-antigen/teichoic acid export membrane protein